MDRSTQTTRKLQPANHKDHHVRWALRVVGALLLAASLFFLSHDLTGLAPAMVWAFAGAAAVGAAAVITSWLPGRRATRARPAVVPARPASRA